MFCDLAGSTALSTRLDPEDLQDVIRGYQDTVTGRKTSTVSWYRSILNAKKLVDGVTLDGRIL